MNPDQTAPWEQSDLDPYFLQNYKPTKIYKQMREQTRFEPWHEISKNVVSATNKASDQSVHMHSLFRAFASHLNIL